MHICSVKPTPNMHPSFKAKQVTGTAIAAVKMHRRPPLCYALLVISRSQRTLAGILTGLVTAIVRSPTSVVKYQLQLKLYDSTREAVESTYRRAGLLGFFAGLRATVYLDVFYAVTRLSEQPIHKISGTCSLDKSEKNSGRFSLMDAAHFLFFSNR